MEDSIFQCDIEKVDTDQNLVFGWFYKSHDKDGNLWVDKQGDFIDDPAILEKAAYEFVLESRQGDELHLEVPVSDMVESVVFTPEKMAKMGIPEGTLPTSWWGGFHVHDGPVWDEVKKGNYKMFSIGGTGIRQQIDEAELVNIMQKRDFNTAQRKKLAGSGGAMSDGSFPIENAGDLKNAIRLVGNAKNPAVAKAWIIRRARALGLTGNLPDTWVSKLDPSQAVLIKNEQSRERFAGVGLRKDESGFFVHSNQVRSLSYESPINIPDVIIEQVRAF